MEDCDDGIGRIQLVVFVQMGVDIPRAEQPSPAIICGDMDDAAAWMKVDRI